MGKRNKNKPKISWYYMSLHYGICHGPIDALNQVWIKEKEVFSDNLKEGAFIAINDIEAFGGEEKEGGISGIIEYYPGTQTQKISQTSASRFGLTTDTMPAYRGIASLFFRGYEESELGDVPENSQPSPGFFQLIAKAFAAALGQFDSSTAVSGILGFLWAANNPYLPAAWAHVTRIGRPFSPQWASVPFSPGEFEVFDFPAPTLIQNGSLNVWSNPYIEVDLTEIARQVDTGTVTFTVNVSGTWTSESGTPGGALQIFRRAFDENGGELTAGFLAEEGGANDGESFTNSGGLSETRTIPAGTRKLRYITRSVFSSFQQDFAGTASCTAYFRRQGEKLSETSPLLGAPHNMNPAHIVAECLTNRVWGLGKPLSSLDLSSFQDAAETFFNEYFGLSMLWREQMKIESFIQEVLDHCQATVFLDPRSGLWTMKAIRGDYDINNLPELTPSNCTTRNRQRKAQGDIINEVVIQYTDHRTEESQSITFHDIASVSQLGQIVSDTRNYYGIRDPILANKVGARDIRSASYPIFTCDVEGDRTLSFVRPGSVLRLDVPEDGIVGMVVRVSKVDYGEAGDRRVRFSVSEDIFSLEATTFETLPTTLWQDNTGPPDPLAYQRLVEVPLPMLFRAGLTESDLSDDNFPEVIVAALGNDPSQSVQDISVWGPETRPNGSTVNKVIGTVPETPTGVLTVALPSQATSSMSGVFVRRVAFPQVAQDGDFFYIDGDGESGEFVMLDTYTSATDTWTVRRGMYDTTPKAWPIGSLVWYCEEALRSFYPGAASAGVPFNAKLLPRTGGGVLRQAVVPAITHTPTARPYLPFRPANCALGGVSFGEREYSSNDVGGIPSAASVSWANRNRTLEDGQARRWTDANVSPEPGQTVTLLFYERAEQTLVYTVSGLSGTSGVFNANAAELQEFRFYDVEFRAERAGDLSIQGHRIGLSLERLGYGNNYGYDYGQNDGS